MAHPRADEPARNRGFIGAFVRPAGTRSLARRVHLLAPMTKVSVELIKMIPALDGLRDNPIARAAVDILVHLAELAELAGKPRPDAVNEEGVARLLFAKMPPTRRNNYGTASTIGHVERAVSDLVQENARLATELAIVRGDLARVDEALQAARRVNEQGVTQRATYENALASAEKAKREAVASWSTLHGTAARSAATYRAAMIRALFGDAYESDASIASCNWTDVMVIDEVRARLAAKSSVGAKLLALVEELRGAL